MSVEFKKAYLIGNGASIPYGSPPGGQLFAEILDLWRMLAEEDTLRSGACYSRLREGLERIMDTFDDLLGRTAWGNIRGLHGGVSRELFEKLKDPYTDAGTREKCYSELRAYLSSMNIWELFPKVLKCAVDVRPCGFIDQKDKIRRLVTDPKGNFYHFLADLSFMGIFCILRTSQENPGLYESFSQLLGRQGPVLIVNLNYDTLLEKALRQRGTRFAYGGVGEVPSDDVVECMLYKPHGSFDMLYCSQCGSIVCSQDVDVASKAGSPKRYCDSPGCDQRRLPSFFVPYTAVSAMVRYSDQLQLALGSLKEKLEGIQEIVSIGYSFTEHQGDLVDRHLRFIFDDRRVRVVAKDKNESREVCRRLDRFRIESIDSKLDGFEGFLEKELRS